MSYDIQVGNFERNYTSNMSNLWSEHYKGGEKLGQDGIMVLEPSGLEALDGKTGREGGEILLQMFQAINQTRIAMGDPNEVGEPKMTAKYDSPNGWGSLVGQLIFIGEIAAACAIYPDEKITVG